MNSDRLAVARNKLTGDGPLDTATSRAVLAAVSNGEMPETFEVGTAHRVLAFGKHDTTSDGFAKSVSVASDSGFQPTVRIAGGRVAVFHEATIRFGWTRTVEDPATTIHDGFRLMSKMVTDTLGVFGIHGIVGEVPGEYCPGAYSVHIAGKKVMGVGQRLTRNAAHVGGVIVMDNSESINDVLIPVYKLLGISLDPEATGSVADALPIDTETFADAFTTIVAGGRPIDMIEIPDAVREQAATLRPDHDPAPTHDAV